jgi:hypothetical protein
LGDKYGNDGFTAQIGPQTTGTPDIRWAGSAWNAYDDVTRGQLVQFELTPPGNRIQFPAQDLYGQPFRWQLDGVYNGQEVTFLTGGVRLDGPHRQLRMYRRANETTNRWQFTIMTPARRRFAAGDPRSSPVRGSSTAGRSTHGRRVCTPSPPRQLPARFTCG